MPDVLDAQAAHRRAMAARGPSPAELAAHQQMASVVGLRMERLQAEDEWGTFWLHVEGGYQALDEAALTSSREQFESGTAVGDALALVALRIQYLRGRLDAYRDLRALPVELVRRSAEAQKLLDTPAPGMVQDP